MTIKSKIHFETLSQHLRIIGKTPQSCWLLNQRYILKPFHNGGLCGYMGVMLLTIKSKIHFETLSQLKSLWFQFWYCCWLLNQRYILKPFHNNILTSPKGIRLLTIKSKIHFETLSQLSGNNKRQTGSCWLLNQRYILKPFHNSFAVRCSTRRVVDY